MSQSLLSRAASSKAKKPTPQKSSGAAASGEKPAVAEDAGLKSKLLASLFEKGDAGQPFTVLDVGPAVPETVAYFNRYRCKLHFIDLYSERAVNTQKQHTQKALMLKHFKRLLAFKADTQFDVCLFWDFLNYLDGAALEAFGEALRPYIHHGTKAHGFGVLNAKTALADLRYGVRSHEWISTRPRSSRGLTCFPHSQTALKDKLSGFDIDRGTLLSDGRLEILFKGAQPD